MRFLSTSKLAHSGKIEPPRTVCHIGACHIGA
jgi:hypothetical protein